MSASSFFIEKLLIPATIATLTVVITIGYQQYSGTSNLTLFIVEQSIIVESVDGISELDIIYNGKKVKKLFSTKFILENTGNKSIKKENFVSPILLEFEDNILGVIYNAVDPKSLEGSIYIHNDNNKNITFKIPLLNPKDKIFFSVLSESEKVIPKVNARIEGISDIILVNTKDTNSDDKLFAVKIKYGIMFLIFIFTTLISIIFFTNFIKKRKYMKSAKAVSILQGVESDEQLRQKIKEDLSFLSKENRVYIYKSIIELIDQTSNINDSHVHTKITQISSLIELAIKKDTQGVAAVLFLVISVILFRYFYM